MKLKSKKAISFTIIAFVLLCIIGCFFLFNKKEDRLSQAKIDQLRDQYPICGIHIPPLIDMRTPSLAEVIERSDSFIYGEVTGEYSTSSQYISSGNQALDDKREDNGLSNDYDFYEYSISIIDDSEGLYKKGEQITIYASLIFIDYNPKLSKGMKVIVPVSKDKRNAERNYYNAIGMYYVTEDGYAISAYEEDMNAELTLNGKKVDVVLDELKK